MTRQAVGRLNRRFSLATRSTTKDGLGEPANTYTETARFWGRLRSGRQRTAGEGGVIFTEQTLMLRTRFRTDLKAGGLQRITDLQTSRTYRLDNVVDVGDARTWLDLVVVEQPEDPL